MTEIQKNTKTKLYPGTMFHNNNNNEKENIEDHDEVQEDVEMKLGKEGSYN